MSPSQRPCADSQLGLWKSTNSAENINTSQVTENNFLADEIGLWKIGAGIYLYIHLHYRSIGETDRLKKSKISFHQCCGAGSRGAAIFCWSRSLNFR